MNERAGKVWIKLYNAKKEHGEKSSEYCKALKEWVKFLKTESSNTRSKVEQSSKDLRAAWKNLCKAKEGHGINSEEFKIAEKELDDIKKRVNKMAKDIDPIYRAVMSL